MPRRRAEAFGGVQIAALNLADGLAVYDDVAHLSPGSHLKILCFELVISQDDSCAGDFWVLPGRRQKINDIF